MTRTDNRDSQDLSVEDRACPGCGRDSMLCFDTDNCGRSECRLDDDQDEA